MENMDKGFEEGNTELWTGKTPGTFEGEMHPTSIYPVFVQEYRSVDVELLDGDVMYIPKRPGEPDCTWADISKAKKLLNWQPKVSLEEGVGILLENIDYWREAPVWDKKSIAKATEKWFEYLS